MTDLWLVRARLRRDAQVAALAPLLLPEGEGERASASHRLMWSLMPPDADAARDFLWREEAPGRFLLLTRRRLESGALFDVEAQSFAPALAAGDRLRFLLRANPTIARREAGRRGKREDVVMHALFPVPGKKSGEEEGKRAEERPALIVRAGTDWLVRTGARTGFVPDADGLRVDGYRRLRFSRPAGKEPIMLGTLDFEGLLTVTDPRAFLAALTAGFGRARAFGCGLMLIRRA